MTVGRTGRLLLQTLLELVAKATGGILAVLVPGILPFVLSLLTLIVLHMYMSVPKDTGVHKVYSHTFLHICMF